MPRSFHRRCVAIALLWLGAGASQATLTVSAGLSSCERVGNLLVSCALASAVGSGDHAASVDVYSFTADVRLRVIADAGLLRTAATDQPATFSLGTGTRELGGGWRYEPDRDDPFTPMSEPAAWGEAGRFRSLVDARIEAQDDHDLAGDLFDALSTELPQPVPLAVMIGLTGLVLVGLLRGLQGR
jgi:hypothetical protein